MFQALAQCRTLYFTGAGHGFHLRSRYEERRRLIPSAFGKLFFPAEEDRGVENSSKVLDERLVLSHFLSL
jgi:hypothetical protein